MNPTLETIKKGQEEFDKKFGDKDNQVPGNMKIIATGTHMLHLYRWHTSFLISLFEGEVKRLKEQKYKCTQELLDEIREQKIKNRQTQTMFISHGLIEATRLQIKHYQEIIDYLKSIV